MGWNSNEDLICILEEGTMAAYSINGLLKYSRPVSREVREHRVLDCKFFHTMEGSGGFAVMTNCYQFFVVADTCRPRDEIRVKKVADLPSMTVRPNCWNVLTPQCNILVSVEEKLYILDQYEAIPQSVLTSKKDPSVYWAEIAVSVDGKAVALVDKGGYLWGGTSDFKTCETEMDLQSTAKVLAMEWGAKDFFVLVMEKLIFVKGFGKHWCKYPGKLGCCLQPEVDGLRLVSNTTSEFIHRVTSQSLAVLRIGSMEPGALLNDAFKEYEGDESHKADEYIRFIKDKLPDAILQCIKAAGEEFEPALQQSLLRSARFGKGFLGPEISSEVVNEFVEMCHHLRVLNSVRMEKIGVPITLRQYYRLSTGVLTDRSVLL
ncbi:Vacuolar protein sorting-associated protein 16 homolog [Geodia barretti]|uniref:Vacuolar protein sorting-associated protein 16 homolog n=1 Tax=Geodia barretti TaxID=519541 RepID=A0AA35SK41_GEOBA|nr:Vacuolar protein sorting-associated protein 16 homolog [Geodia barretti]